MASSTSSSKEQMMKTDECEAYMLSLSSSEDLTIDPVSGLAAPTPPGPLHLFLQSEPWMGAEVTADILVQPKPLVTAEESPLLASDSLTVDLPVLAPHHECSLCLKMFGTTTALNKHLLSHQQERPHVCSICQRAFKRHDHLNGHMLTHQKRMQFQCAELGCQKSYFDSHSLKRHYSSQHISPFTAPITQSHSAAPQWEPVDRPAGAGSSDYHSVSPPQSKADRHPESSDYSAFGNYSSSVGLSPQCGLLMKAQLGSTTVEFPSPHSWDSGTDIMASDLQTLEEMLSYQPCSRPADSRGDGLAKPASPTETQSEQRDAIKQTYDQMSSESSNQDQPPLYSVENLKPTACSFSIIPSKSVPLAAFSFSRSALPNRPNPGLPPPAVVPPGLCSVASTKTCPDRVDNRKRSERRRKVHSVELAALPIPSPRLESHLAPCRAQPRPLYLVSPSQVAMASFSDSTSCQPLKGGNLTKLGEGQEVSDRMTPTPQHANKARASGRPSRPSIKIECHSPESEEAVPPSERSEYMSLSPLVLPVSVPVSVKTKADMEREHSRRASADVRSRRNHRLDFMNSLIIPPPKLPPASPCRLLGAEGLGGLWCRAAGGYPSQLRSPVYLADHLLNPSFQPPPYTPPPMLSPLRPGTGLYFSTLPPPHPCPPPPSTYTATLDGADGISLVMDDTVVNIQPRINVGQRFQADVPPRRHALLLLYDEHPAQLAWSPWGDLSSSAETQERVTELMGLCCSSVLPGGGTNTELALHCLHEVQGDVLAALDLLLIRGDYRSSIHHLHDYHYTGSDHWSPLEKRLFRKALLTHEKDFQLIHTELHTKSVSQCVEYYYGMKKLKKFKPRNRVSDKKEGAESMERRGLRRTLAKPEWHCCGLSTPPHVTPCVP